MSAEPIASPVPIRCIHLRCKAMLVYGEAFMEDPDYQAGNVDFWCLATGQALGPDGGPAELPACSDPKRTCHHAD